MEVFRYLEKNKLNNKTYFLIGNLYRVIVLESSELKNSVLSGKINAKGIEIQKYK